MTETDDDILSKAFHEASKRTITVSEPVPASELASLAHKDEEIARLQTDLRALYMVTYAEWQQDGATGQQFEALLSDLRMILERHALLTPQEDRPR